MAHGKVVKSSADDLSPNTFDRGVAISKALAGSVPFAGSFLTELIDQVIPNQRQDRFVSYLRELNQRLEVLEAKPNAENLSSQQTALFEDGAHAAVRAVNSERIKRIARIVADGFVGDAIVAEDQRRFLIMLGELFDDDIAVLCSYTRIGTQRSRTKGMSGGDIKQTTEPELLRYKERTAIEAQQNRRLISLGLLQQESRVQLHLRDHRAPKAEILPLPAQITQLGLVLLSKLGLVTLARVSEYTVDWVLAPSNGQGVND